MKKNPQRPRHSESGAGMLEVLLAVAVLGFGGFSIINMSKNTLQANRHIEYERHRNQLVKVLLNATDCTQLSPCVGAESKDLMDSNGKILVRADGKSKYGPWSVKAECRSSKEIEVRVALLNAKSTLGKAPLTGKLIDWTSLEGVLIETGVLCGRDALPPQATIAVYGPYCAASTGSCPHPFRPSRPMCCDDGRDAAKPYCPAGTGEFTSFWDRQGDWGGHGQWVVLCR